MIDQMNRKQKKPYQLLNERMETIFNAITILKNPEIGISKTVKTMREDCVENI